MKAQIINEEDIVSYKVASLPTRPTTPKEYGGAGYTSKEMKEAFDRLPLYIIERFNDLIDDITCDNSDSIIASIKLGYGNGITLQQFIDLIISGQILALIPVGDEPMAVYLGNLRKDIDACKAALGI